MPGPYPARAIAFLVDSLIAGHGDTVNPDSSKHPTGRGGPTSNLFRWAAHGERLPMHRRTTGNRVGGALALLAGIPWLVESSRFFVGEVQRSGFDAGLALPLLLVLGGLLVSLFGVSQFIYRESVTIDETSVRWTRVGMTGYRAWREPLSRYRGVLKDALHRDPTHGTDYTEYRLTLEHPDPGKTVRLYEARGTLFQPPEDWNRLWVHYAELFGLPVLEADSEGVVATAPEDLDRPLLAKIADGKETPTEFDPARAELPMGLALRREDDLWVASLTPAARLQNGVALIVVAGGLLAAAWFLGLVQDPRLALAFAGVLGLAAVLFGAATGRRYRHPDQVAVDRNDIWYRTWTGKPDWDTRSMPLDELVDIAVRRDMSRPGQPFRVVVAGRKREFAIGQSLTDAARHRLRALLLALIKDAQSHGGRVPSE